MEKIRRKTKEEKQSLVNNYLESGLSKKAWCENNNDYKVFLACGSVDMRKSINGLYNNFDIDPRDKILFGFCNRQRNRVKILYGMTMDSGYILKD